MPGLRRFIALAALLTYVAFSPAPVAGISGGVVISQVYGGGGNSGAQFKNDFIELHNRGGSPIDLTGWSVQYAAATGMSWAVTTLTGTLAPGQFYLVQEFAGPGAAENLPTQDASGGINMAAGAGKVALVSSTTALTGSCPLSSVVDFVGYGATPNCAEGSGRMLALSNTTAALRVGFGCTDTDSNSADFVVGAPNPRNTASIPGCSFPSGTASASPNVVSQGGLVTLTVIAKPGSTPANTNLTVTGDLSSIGGSATQLFTLAGANATTGEQTFTWNATIGGAITQGPKSLPITITDGIQRQGTTAITLAVRSPFVTRIHDIQGNGNASPIADTTVTTEGLITGVRSNGFFIQDLPANYDADPNTSEAVFVFTSSAPPAGAAVGNMVLVIGTISEFFPSADPFQPPTTEVVNPFVSVQSSGVEMIPEPVELTPADLDAGGPIDQLERLEGMRVSVASLTVVAPTGGTVNEASATSTSSGVFYGVLPGVARPFREPGIEVFEPVPVDAPTPATVPRFDANPERIRVDSDALGGATLDVTPGQTVSTVVGPLDYGFRSYTIDVEPATPPTVSGAALVPIPTRAPLSGEFTVAAANLERFFDTVNDPATSDAVLTATAFANRLNKVSLQIRNIMRSPDVIGVEEVENLSTLQLIAAKVNNDAATAGEPDPSYVAYLQEGNDIGGIDSGFLVKTSRVTVVDVTQEGLATTFTQPDGSQALLNDRPPLVLRASVHQSAGDAGLPITVIVNHLRSLSGINDAADGARVRAKRRAQAEFLATLIHDRMAHNALERIVSVGDYNAFQFNDGYVDSIGTIKGTPTPAAEVTLASSDLVDPDLIDLVDRAPADQRYSFLFDGNAQELDHVVVTPNILDLSDGLGYGRNNADFAEVFRGNPNSPVRVSDHDPLVAYFAFPVETTTTVVATPPTSTFGDPITFTATVMVGVTPVTTGSVSFSVEGTPLADAIALDSAGTASFTTALLPAGAHTVTAVYLGVGAVQSSAADVTVVVHSAPTTTSVVSSNNPSGVGQAVTFTATVTSSVIGPGVPVAVGSVTFSEGGQVLGTVQVDANGRALLTTSTLGGGSHQIVAGYNDGNDYLASSATVTQRVQPAISINDVSVAEGNSGASSAATFTVTLSAPSTDLVSVHFATADGTAKDGVGEPVADYVANAGTLVFNPGQTTQTIVISVKGDDANEPDETFSVNLSNPVNATIADASGTGTIVNDDVPQITGFSPAQGAAGTVVQITGKRFSHVSSVRFNGVATLFVVKSPTTITAIVPLLGTSGPISVTTSEGTATSATNFIVLPRVIAFAPAAARPGAAVFVVGTGFFGVTNVKIGDVAAPFTVLAPELIQLTVPAGAATVKISVTTTSGTAVSAVSFRVLH